MSRRDASLELVGEWWLPGHEDDRVAGTLSSDDSGAITLSLIGSLQHRQVQANSAIGRFAQTLRAQQGEPSEGSYQRIHGVSGGKAITLEDCFQTQFHVDGGGSTERLHVHAVFVGAWMELGESLQFTKLQVWLDWMVYWVATSAIHRPIEFTKDENESLSPYAAELRAEALDPIVTFTTDDGLEIAIKHELTSSGDSASEIRIEQDFLWSISRDSLTDLDDLMKVASCLQALVSIGTAKPAAFRRLQLFHPDVTMDEAGQHPAPIDYYAQWHLQPVPAVSTFIRARCCSGYPTSRLTLTSQPS